MKYVRVENKLEILKQRIAERGNLLIAFSGGVDSSLLTRVAYDVLGEKALAVTLDSETLPRSELEHAKKIAKAIGIKHMIIPSLELLNEDFVKNPLNRCYYCKKASAKMIEDVEEILKSLGFSQIRVRKHDDIAV